MAAEIFRSRRDLGENLDENLGENLDAFLAAEILRSRQDLVENLDEILTEISARIGEFLAAEILRSRRDLAEISPRSRRDLGNLAGQKLAERSRSKFCRGLAFLGIKFIYFKIIYSCNISQ